MVDNLINCNDLGHSEHNKYMFTLWTTDLEHLKITLLFSLCLGFTDINYFAYIDIKFMCMPLGLFWFSYLCCFVWILIVITGHKKGPFEFSWTKKQTFFFGKLRFLAKFVWIFWKNADMQIVGSNGRTLPEPKRKN